MWEKIFLPLFSILFSFQKELDSRLFNPWLVFVVVVVCLFVCFLFFFTLQTIPL